MSSLRRLPPIFYLGLFPVVCLLWLWADSLTYRITWSLCRQWDLEHVVELRESAFHFIRQTAAEKYPGQAVQYEPQGPLGKTGAFGSIYRFPLQPARTMSSDLLFQRTGFSSTGPSSHGHYGIVFSSRKFVLPLWLALLVYVPLWLGVVKWQARRRRKRRDAEIASVDGHHESKAQSNE